MIISKTKKEKVLKWVKSQKECADSNLIVDLRKGAEKYFELREIEYPFGKRKVFFRKNQEKYELLQGTRSLAVPRENDSFENLMEKGKDRQEEIMASDLVRINELDNIKKQLGDVIPDFKSVAEIGFRTPRLLKYYLEREYAYAIGYDVLEANVIAAQFLGYNADVYDLNECEKDLDLKNIDLVLAYHVLEHVSDPHKAIKKISESMSPDSHFHVEIPIEPGIPNIRYCHLFPFESGDIRWMLEDAGFQVLTFSMQTHPDGPVVERYLVKK